VTSYTEQHTLQQSIQHFSKAAKNFIPHVAALFITFSIQIIISLTIWYSACA